VNPLERIAAAAMDHSKVVILVMLLLTAAVGAGASQVESDSSLNQFESDSPEAKAQSFSGEQFDPNPNATTVQIIVRNESGNVLTKDSLLRSLEYQQRIRDDDQIGPTLAENQSTVGVGNVVARTLVIQNRSAALQERGAALERRNETLAADFTDLRVDSESIERRNASLQEDRRALQQESQQLNATVENLTVGLGTLQQLQTQYDELNASYEQGLINETQYEANARQIEQQMSATRAEATDELDATNADEFDAAADQLVALQAEYHRINQSLDAGEINRSQYEARAGEIEAGIAGAYRNGTRGVLAEEFAALEADSEELAQRAEQLQADAAELQERSEQLQERRAELQADFQAFQADLQEFQQNPPTPSIDEQIEALESRDAETVRNVTTTVLSGNGAPGAEQALQLMPRSYDPGSDTASARMLFVTQEQQEDAVPAPGGFSERITDAQLQMQTLAESQSNGEEYLVFGFGVINEEISQSQTDSNLIVGPLAILFVLVTLLIAYRDLLDIFLGVLGIALVLVWTFGFMGWAGIAFNQIMIAVPVLLIGLSIDYAIHIFMRHREARQDENGNETARSSMKFALAGVGTALLWVTATTVIGFMSNLISPLGPIQDFGVASSAGIVATLLIFGLLIPALKVEIDGFFESRLGWDRKKRAFGTGGGAFSRVLSVGSGAARKAPLAVILVALVLTGAGAAGATQVDTSFEQSDFLADEPPEILYDLPEPFKPGEYSAKKNLNYVYDNFQSPDQQAQVVINATDGNAGSVATADTLARLDAAERDLAADDRYTDTVFIGASGQANVLSPLTVMDDVAARNESFNESFQAADTDGDGVPDQNVTALYDQLYEVAPDQAQQVIYRNDAGEYTSVRFQVAVNADASTGAITADMRTLAAERFDDADAGLTATATGDPIINEIVQEQLLDTVIESLLVTLVAVFVFLMIVYRITDGSATLGMVTLLPVALSVAWILGTMFLIGIPFNVITGTITSLTIGLGVAYSIHLSERFNLEMERQDGKVWPAMERSVTGTGGALLGSAATTAGGFGVLAFALLPALQQFGIITAITIVYAFLASVFVLPSLLAVWTRYLGPDDADFDADPTGSPESDDDARDDPDDESDPLTGGTGGGFAGETDGEDDPLVDDAATSDAEGTTATGPATEGADGAEATGESDGTTADDPLAATDDEGSTEDGASAEDPLAPSDGDETPTDDAPDTAASDDGDVADADGASADAEIDGASADGEPAAGAGAAAGAASTETNGDTDAADEGIAPVAGPAETAAPRVDIERSVAPADPEPGEELTVSVVARDVSGRVVLTETVPGTGGSVTSFDPDPVVRTRDGRTVYVVWDLPEETDAGMTYTTQVSDDATGGEQLDFDGAIETATDEVPIEGDVEVSVVTPFLAQLRSADVVTDEDLETAGRLAREGDLTGDAFRAVYREWLRGRPEESPAPIEREDDPVFEGAEEPGGTD